MEDGYYWIKNIHSQEVQIVMVEDNEVWFFGKDYPHQMNKLPEFEFVSERIASYKPS